MVLMLEPSALPGWRLFHAHKKEPYIPARLRIFTALPVTREIKNTLKGRVFGSEK